MLCCLIYLNLKNKQSIFISVGIIFLLFIFNSFTIINAQSQQSGSLGAVSSICNMIQNNGFLAGIIGLDKASSICNNLNSLNSQQALSSLCSMISNTGILNIKNICNQQQQLKQQQGLNQTQHIQAKNGTQDNMQNNKSTSNSLIDKAKGVISSLLR
jgi:bifunctional ADP-heptose synthase (sugar kinase/adenylyltransferase)